MESVVWQGLALSGIFSWIVITCYFNITQKIRSLLQPWVSHHVVTDTSFILKIQKHQHKILDALFSVLSCVVSVPFYTAFLPLLFWSGHGKLARQMTLLIAFCDYLGNCIKLVFSRFLVYYVLAYIQSEDACVKLGAVTLACVLVGLIGFGRIYLGMHNIIDITGGLIIGLVILALWLIVHEYVDAFIVSGQNVTSFWAGLSFLLLFAYPTPESPTPSFEYHTAFDGVAFGIVAGVQPTYQQFHHEAVPRIFTSQLTVPAFLGRMLVGIPTILIVKFCSKSLAKWILPVVSNTLGIPIKSTSYIPMLNGSTSEKKSCEIKQCYIQKMLFFSNQDLYDVDTGIRFVQYAGLAWSVVDLVPSLFSHLRL